MSETIEAPAARWPWHINLGVAISVIGVATGLVTFVFGIGGYVTGQRADIQRLSDTQVEMKHDNVERALTEAHDIQSVRDDLATGLQAGQQERRQTSAAIGDIKDQVAGVKETVASIKAQQDFIIEELHQLRTTGGPRR